jgi:hypothetical protein
VVAKINNQGSISPTCLREAFTCQDPKSAKRQSSHQCLFALLGPACAKAAHKMLVKSTSDDKASSISSCKNLTTLLKLVCFFAIMKRALKRANKFLD